MLIRGSDLFDQGNEPRCLLSGPFMLAAMVTADSEKWRPVIKELGIKAD